MFLLFNLMTLLRSYCCISIKNFKDAKISNYNFCMYDMKCVIDFLFDLHYFSLYESLFQWLRKPTLKSIQGTEMSIIVMILNHLPDSLGPSDTYVNQYNIPSLLLIMAGRLTGAKPMSEPMLSYCQLVPKEHISYKFHVKFKSLHLRRCT